MTTELAYDSKEYAADELRKLFPPGSTAYTILRHVSSSGMTRWISVIADTPDGPDNVSHWVARIMGKHANRGKHEGIRVGGCGMDMGFHLVYGMSRILYRDGFDCIQYTREGSNLAADDRSRLCPSNDHSNDYRLRTFSHHSDGGYAVSHQWL
jgi:hypothetical protein